jgi:hypothetical protein
MTLLSILCVTQAAPAVRPLLADMAHVATLLGAEFVLLADGQIAQFELREYPVKLVAVKSQGYVESVLDYGVSQCSGKYILRLDDDERCSMAMIDWLQRREYEAETHWKFPRMHLWGNANTVLITEQLFPDHQTRLSIKEKSGGRHFPHAMSPFGGGELAPVCIEHHKFLVRSRAERERTAAKWHQGDMKAFSLPEDVIAEKALLVEKGYGHVPWQPKWSKHFVLQTSPGG